MEALSLFLLKSIAVSGLLTFWYLLVLRGRRLHRYNRFFLLSILCLGITIPLFKFKLFNIPPDISATIAPVVLFDQGVNQKVIPLPSMAEASQAGIDPRIVGSIVIVVISVALLSFLLFRVFRLRKMCLRNSVTRFEGVNLIFTDSSKAPFTFLRYVFWRQSLPLQSEIGRLIFKHERAHVAEGHTYDKLFCQVLTCIFWFNPFFWIIQKELNIVHEFSADEQAVSNRDTDVFARMLLACYNSGSYLVPEHHFFASAVKRRLMMVQNAEKPSYPVLRRFMALPIIVGTITLFSFGQSKAEVADTIAAQKKVVVVLDAGHGGKDVGEQWGGLTEKEICLKYAQRIKQLAIAYNVEVRLTRDDDRYMPVGERFAITANISPDVFVSLHVNNDAKIQGQGDMDIYISGESAYAARSSNFSNEIFAAMAKNGFALGTAPDLGHVHSPGCNCDNCEATAIKQKKDHAGILSSEQANIALLKDVPAPGIVFVLGNLRNRETMRQLSDDDRLDALCRSILQGIVAGVSRKESAVINAGNNFSPFATNIDLRKCR